MTLEQDISLLLQRTGRKPRSRKGCKEGNLRREDWFGGQGLVRLVFSFLSSRQRGATKIMFEIF